MDDDDGIVLNLSSGGGSGGSSQKPPRRPQNVEDTHQQAKPSRSKPAAEAFKFIPKTNGKTSPGSVTGATSLVRGKEQAKVTAAAQRSSGAAGAKQHGGQQGRQSGPRDIGVVSSLFRGNPAIPKPQPVKEKASTSSAAEQPEASRAGKVEVFSKAKTFEDLGIIHRMVANLDSTLHMDKPTGVQSMSVPMLLAGHDCLVQSQTGSGKTLAYSLPLVQKLSEIEPRIDRNDGPYAFVLLPTRELALQSFHVLQKACKCCCWVVPGCITGGEKKKAEKARIRKGLNIIVATPGRLLDHIENTNSFSLSKVRWLVLDEADRLLDLGFEKDLNAIIQALDKAKTDVRRQSVLLSATLSSGVERLASISLHEPKFINMRDLDQQGSFAEGAENTFHAPSTLTQHFLFVPSKVRLVALAAFLRVQTLLNADGKVIVFLSSRDSVDFLHGIMERLFDQLADEDESLSRARLLKLHGNMGQTDRVHVFEEFRKSAVGVLFCTDVGARGLDLQQVSWILQFTPPCSVADYVHRVGRTARIGQSGKALLFLLPHEQPYLKVLEDGGMDLKEVTVRSLLKSLVKQKKPTDAQIESAATDVQLSCERFVTADEDLKKLASDACLSYVRAYTTYPVSLKHIFHRRALHLGHVAKSFALRTTPTQIATSGQVRVERKRKKQVDAEHGGYDDDDEEDDEQRSRSYNRPSSDVGAFKKKRRTYVSENDNVTSRFAGPMPGKKKKKK